jgi:hypothetical protein
MLTIESLTVKPELARLISMTEKLHRHTARLFKSPTLLIKGGDCRARSPLCLRPYFSTCCFA